MFPIPFLFYFYCRHHLKDRDELVHVYYSALNFRDIMTATGKLAIEVIARGRMNQVS